jgi:hypothetical protein
MGIIIHTSYPPPANICPVSAFHKGCPSAQMGGEALALRRCICPQGNYNTCLIVFCRFISMHNHEKDSGQNVYKICV